MACVEAGEIIFDADREEFLPFYGSAGAALMLFAFFCYTGDDLGLTITGPLLHLR